MQDCPLQLHCYLHWDLRLTSDALYLRCVFNERTNVAEQRSFAASACPLELLLLSISSIPKSIDANNPHSAAIPSNRVLEMFNKQQDILQAGCILVVLYVVIGERCVPHMMMFQTVGCF